MSRTRLPAAVLLSSLGIVVALALWIFAPFFRDTRTMGFQDWDVQAAYRYVTVLSLKDHGQLPWWNPWFCGGFPAWGYAEAATNLVSPFGVLYALFPFPLALRLEAVAATIAGVLTTYLLAGRFTSSPGWRAFVAAIVMLSSRWALQVSSGHMWHLAYAWMPLALYFFDRSVRERRAGFAVAAGAAMALMIYLGGIYPFPHTALLLGVYALVLAIAGRELRPLGMLAVAGLAALGLSAPKLFPVLDTLARFPRYIDTHEPMTLSDLWVMLTARNQSFEGHPLLAISFRWAWWEWGMYIGVAGVVALVSGLLAGRRPAVVALRLAGLLCILLALGQSIWLDVHARPVFRSQHIPSRLLFPGVLCLALALVGGIEDRWRRFAEGRRWAEPVLLGLVSLYAFDLAHVARQATRAPFRLEVPKVERAAAFAQVGRQPYAYGKPSVADPRLRERYDWPAKIVYPTMLANEGLVRCYGVPPGVPQHGRRKRSAGLPGPRVPRERQGRCPGAELGSERRHDRGHGRHAGRHPRLRHELRSRLARRRWGGHRLAGAGRGARLAPRPGRAVRLSAGGTCRGPRHLLCDGTGAGGALVFASSPRRAPSRPIGRRVMTATSLLAAAIYLVPVAVVIVARSRAGRSIWELAADIPLAVAADLLLVLVLSRFVRLDLAALASRGVWIAGGTILGPPPQATG